MSEAMDGGREEPLSNALEHLRSALHLLDLAEAPGQMGARIDLTIHELYLFMAQLTAGSGFTQIDRNAGLQ
jgi:hypothetical protein